MLTRLIIGMTLAFAVVASAAYATEAEKIVLEKDELVSVLSGFHKAPDASYWVNHDPAPTRAALLAIADDRELMTIVRSRALRALVHFPDEQVTAALQKRLFDEPLDYLRASACEAYGILSGPAGLPVLERALADEKALVRIQAAKSIGKIGGDLAAGALSRGLGAEQNKTVRSVLQESLARLQAAKAE